MIETTIINGKKFTKIENLQEWDKNPKYIEKEDFEDLKEQIKRLKLYKPFLVTEHGIVIGGNMRLRAVKELISEGILTNEVPVTIISFEQVTLDDGMVQTYAFIDGEKSDTPFASQEQIMAEYALSDNDNKGRYDTQAVLELLQPYKAEMPQSIYSLELGYPKDLGDFFEEQKAEGNPAAVGPDPENQQEKDAMHYIVLKWSPSRWEELEPSIQQVKDALGVDNHSDMFELLLEHYEATKDLTEREVNAQDTVNAEVQPTEEQQQS